MGEPRTNTTNIGQLVEYTKTFEKVLHYDKKCTSCENLLGKKEYMPVKAYAAGASASMIGVLNINNAPVVLKIYFIRKGEEGPDYPYIDANIEVEMLRKAIKLVYPDKDNNNMRATQNIIMAYTFGCCDKLFENDFILNSCMRGYLRPYVNGNPVDKDKETAIISRNKVLYCAGQTGKEINAFKPNYHDVAKLVTMEYVDGGTFGQYLTDNVIDDDELKSYIFQLIITLRMMYEQFGFVHQDLHLDNILLKKCVQYNQNKKDNQYYKYIINGDTFYVPAFQMIPKLMDFDNSTYKEITIEKKSGSDTRFVQGYSMILDHYTLLYHIYVNQKRAGSNGSVVQWIESFFPQHLLEKAKHYIKLSDTEFIGKPVSDNHAVIPEYLKNITQLKEKLYDSDLVMGDFFSDYRQNPSSLFDKITGNKKYIIETFKYESPQQTDHN